MCVRATACAAGQGRARELCTAGAAARARALATVPALRGLRRAWQSGYCGLAVGLLPAERLAGGSSRSLSSSLLPGPLLVVSADSLPPLRLGAPGQAGRGAAGVAQ